jgi:hypothetical protein
MIKKVIIRVFGLFRVGEGFGGRRGLVWDRGALWEERNFLLC